METPLLDTVGTWLAVVLTLIVFSYLLGDNVLYRWAEHLFVGAALGYAGVVTFHHILVPRLLNPLLQALEAGEGERIALLLVPLVLGLLLFAKSSKRFSAGSTRSPGRTNTSPRAGNSRSRRTAVREEIRVSTG